MARQTIGCPNCGDSCIETVTPFYLPIESSAYSVLCSPMKTHTGYTCPSCNIIQKVQEVFHGQLQNVDIIQDEVVVV
jgi:predicted RNA-binding Zn-ribbon protein involved in translation (DUF1610 family)